MDGLKSKFDWSVFNNGMSAFAVNRAKFTEQEAYNLLYQELDGTVGSKKYEYAIMNGFVKWRAGINEEGEPCVGWWLERKERPKGSVSCYVFEQRWKDNE